MMDYTLTNQQVLESKILSRARVSPGNKPGVNLSANVSQFANNVVEIPGSIKLHDIGFFAQGNPFDDKPPIDFNTSFVNENVFDQIVPQTFYQNVLVNDANSPLIYEPPVFNSKFQNMNQVERQPFAMKQNLKSAMLTDKDVNVIF